MSLYSYCFPPLRVFPAIFQIDFGLQQFYIGFKLSEEAFCENGALFQPLGVSGWNVKATL
jgi:hypothetical protein